MKLVSTKKLKFNFSNRKPKTFKKSLGKRNRISSFDESNSLFRVHLTKIKKKKLMARLKGIFKNKDIALKYAIKNNLKIIYYYANYWRAVRDIDCTPSMAEEFIVLVKHESKYKQYLNSKIAKEFKKQNQNL